MTHQNYSYPHLTGSQGGMITLIDGTYTYTYDNERNIAIFDKLYALYHESNNSTLLNGGFSQEQRMAGPFMQNRSLFTAAFLWELDYYRELDFTYGILPYPKFDETQTEYYSCVGNNATVFLVPVNSKGSEKVGAVLEALSSEAYKTTTPAYFEYTLQGKYSTSEDMARMIEMLRDTSYMNIGDVLAEVLGGQNEFGGQAMNQSKSGTWASTAAKKKAGIMASLEKFLASIAEIE